MQLNMSQVNAVPELAAQSTVNTNILQVSEQITGACQSSNPADAVQCCYM